MKVFFRILLIILLIVIVIFGGLVGFLTITEFKPADVEPLAIKTEANLSHLPSKNLSILTWNIGYAGLGQEQDFFMDGGTHARPDSADLVQKYLTGIASSLSAQSPDLIMLQEVDIDSSRTYSINEASVLSRRSSVHALNYSCPFVPIPMPPMGKVHSGLLTTTDYTITSADRIALPCPFSWPLSTANLKRCLLVTRMPVVGSDAELVLVNLHLEAYDDGEGKIAQTRQLMDFLEEEYEKGNYVIAGGDFNQIFPGGLEVYPNTHPDLWTPGVLETGSLPEGFGYAYDLLVPSCRLLNQPYDPTDTENTQYYVIDGFIVSPNVKVDCVEGLSLDFEYSDHNPVLMTVSLE